MDHELNAHVWSMMPLTSWMYPSQAGGFKSPTKQMPEPKTQRAMPANTMKGVRHNNMYKGPQANLPVSQSLEPHQQSRRKRENGVEDLPMDPVLSTLELRRPVSHPTLGDKIEGSINCKRENSSGLGDYIQKHLSVYPWLNGCKVLPLPLSQGILFGHEKERKPQ